MRKSELWMMKYIQIKCKEKGKGKTRHGPNKQKQASKLVQ